MPHAVDNGHRHELTVYERGQLAQLRKWKAEGPGWGTRLMSQPSMATARVVQSVIPVSALRAALKGFEKVAQKLGGPKAVLRRGKVDSLQDLRSQPLQTCDRLAQFEERAAIAAAGVSGVATGVFGVAGLVVDVPALITQALRVIHRVGLCYGEDMLTESRQGMVIGIFALASANSMEEKQQALEALLTDNDLLDAAWRDGVERAAERELAKEAAVFSLQTLASRIGMQLGKRKAAGAVPILGAAVGGAVNAWYAHEVAQIARYVFQERWLRAKYPQLTKPAALSAI